MGSNLQFLAWTEVRCLRSSMALVGSESNRYVFIVQGSHTLARVHFNCSKEAMSIQRSIFVSRPCSVLPAPQPSTLLLYLFSVFFVVNFHPKPLSERMWNLKELRAKTRSGPREWQWTLSLRRTYFIFIACSWVRCPCYISTVVHIRT